MVLDNCFDLHYLQLSWLWIAFKIVSFISVLDNGSALGIPAQWVLWIAFKLYFYIGLMTTWPSDHGGSRKLWIAFKLYFYIGLWQHPNRFELHPQWLWIVFKLYFYIVFDNICCTSVMPFIGCELLSNCIFISVFDNSKIWQMKKRLVVNCFQIVFLYRSLTTQASYPCPSPWLWIVFKLYFYIGLWQQIKKVALYYLLLWIAFWICIFISVFDNNSYCRKANSFVVNCFQIVFLYRSLTTPKICKFWSSLLWIAFKLYFYIVFDKRSLIEYSQTMRL